jgi:hypothetical protein
MNLNFDFDLKRHLLSKDMAALVFIAVMSILANLPEGYGGWLLNRQVMLGALIAVVVVALFHFMQLLLLLTITVLAVGANLPKEMAAGLGISQTALLVVLGALIGITLVNRIFRLLPMPGAAVQSEDFDEETYEGGFEHLSVHQQMIYAIAHGRVGIIRKLLENGAGANFSLNGTTPLHLATEKGYSSIVTLLIQHGANLLAQDAKGQTPLDLALALKKFAKTTNILYDATIPLLTNPAAAQQLDHDFHGNQGPDGAPIRAFTPASPYRI